MCVSCRAPAPKTPEIPTAPNALAAAPQLRVELPADSAAAELRVDGPYRLSIATKPATVQRGARLEPTTVRPAGRGMSVGGRPFAAERVTVEARSGDPVYVGSSRYRGGVTVHRVSGSRLKTVNLADVETVLQSVVGSEMPAHWPLDALAAQAVAARTFLLYRKTIRAKQTAHVSRHDVRYLGVASETPRTRRAADLTRGVVLVYQWRMFAAYFHATCGGSTTSVNRAFGEREVPPLAGRPCDYCKEATFYSWTCQLDKRDVAKRLGLAADERVLAIRPAVTRPAIHAHGFAVATNKQTRDYDAYRFRTALGADRLRSTAVTVADAGRTWAFSGHGWGHGVGLCQWGARGLALAGRDWRQIVDSYFPESQLVRIY